MKRVLRNIAAGVVAGVLATTAQAEMKSITIATNPAGSTFFLLGGGFAKTLQEKLGIRATAQPQGGSSVYLPMINAGEMTMGLSSAMDVGFAFTGDGFPRASTDVRALGRIWTIPYAFITQGNSGITKMEDLKGKRVMGNMPTNVALTRLNIAMLKSGDLSTDDVNFVKSGGLIDGINAIVEGRADAAPIAVTMPALIEANGAADGGIRVIANGAMADEAFYGGEVKGTRLGEAKPNKRRAFITETVPIVNFDTLLVTSASLSDDDAYKLIKTLHENWEQLREDYPPLRSVAQDKLALVDVTAPYHSGAIRYFKEVGLWTDAHEAKQASFK